MAGSYRTTIVHLSGGEDLSELNDVLAEEEEKGYELHSLTELTNSQYPGHPGNERLLVVTRKAS
jgi:hypothetical protein